jgi:hypothetical protein
MHRFTLAVLSMSVAAACAQRSDSAAQARAEGLVLRGAEAFMQHRLGDAETLLDSAAAVRGAAPRDHALAEQMRALLAWRFHADAEVGRAHYRAALETGVLRSKAYAGLSRLEAAQRRFGAALDAAGQAQRTAESLGDSAEAAVQLAAAASEPVLEARLAGRAAAPGDADALRRAVEALEPVVAAHPGMLRPARHLVTVALLADDGPAALAGWRSYFLNTLGQPGSGLGQAGSILAAVLPRWRGTAAAAGDRLALVRALARSRMYEEAAAVSAGLAPTPEVAEVRAYAAFLRRVRAAADEYYRRTALGLRRPGELRGRVEAEARRLWPVLFAPASPPAFDWSAFRAETARRFGTYADLGVTAGFYDLHYGHAVLDRTETVEQYGRTARLRYVVLDEMASDGFQTWAWDGEAAHGGWAESETIYHVRPAAGDAALEAWTRWVEHRPSGPRGDRLAADSAEDWSRLLPRRAGAAQTRRHAADPAGPARARPVRAGAAAGVRGGLRRGDGGELDLCPRGAACHRPADGGEADRDRPGVSRQAVGNRLRAGAAAGADRRVPALRRRPHAARPGRRPRAPRAGSVDARPRRRDPRA